MIQDYSYGIIPLMQKDWIRYTILVHLSSGNHRWLPKWHAEPWESEIQSAIRELKEETGVQITEHDVDNTKQYSESYQCFSKRHKQQVKKTVIYYTANIPYNNINISWYSESDGEIVDKKLISLDDAISLVTYDESRNILIQILSELKKSEL